MKSKIAFICILPLVCAVAFTGCDDGDDHGFTVPMNAGRW
jgi:hypothetical protein